MSPALSNQLQLNQDTGNTANNTKGLFPELSISELSQKALKWQLQFPFIHKILLYPDIDNKFFLIFVLKKMRKRRTRKRARQLYSFYNQFGEGPFFNSEFKDDLVEAYKQDDKDLKKISYENFPVWDWKTVIYGQDEPFFYPDAFKTGRKDSHWLLSERIVHPLPIHESDELIIKNAQLNGRISDIHLIQILANNEAFTNRWLPILWSQFGCEGQVVSKCDPNSNGSIPIFLLTKNLLDISTLSGRLRGWLIFINRITHGFLRAPWNKPDTINDFRPNLIRKYSWEDEDEPVMRKSEYFRDRGYNGLILNLDDIKEYFNQYCGISESFFPAAGSSTSLVSISSLPGEPTAPGDTTAQVTQDQARQDGNNLLHYINDPCYGEWLDMREYIQSKYHDDWKKFEHVCRNPFEPEPEPSKPESKPNPYYWKRMMLCRAACLKMRLDEPGISRDDIYEHLKQHTGYLKKPENKRINRTDSYYPPDTFKTWTSPVYPEGFLKRGAPKKKK